MVPTESAYRTPLGVVRVDHEFLGLVGEKVALTRVEGDEEHSLEIELPFLQVSLGSFTVAPIMLGEYVGEPGAQGRVVRLAEALASLADERTLLVAAPT